MTRPYPEVCPDPNDQCGGCQCIHLKLKINDCLHYQKTKKICFCDPMPFAKAAKAANTVTGGRIPTQAEVDASMKFINEMVAADQAAQAVADQILANPQVAANLSDLVVGELAISAVTNTETATLQAPDTNHTAPPTPVQAGKPVPLLAVKDDFYPVPCPVCQLPIPRTGRRGRPPVTHVECK